MIRITFIDGQKIDVNDDTVLIGIDNYSKPNNDEDKECFYLCQKYNSLQDSGLALGTSDPRLGITGFILSHDCFTLGESLTETIYMSSAVKSISVI